MIEVTKLDGSTYYLNPHQIEAIECRPDTTFTMLSGKKLVVRDKFETVLERIIEYRRKIGLFKNED